MAKYGRTQDPQDTPLDVDSDSPDHVTFTIPTDSLNASVEVAYYEMGELLGQLYEWFYNANIARERKDAKYVR